MLAIYFKLDFKMCFRVLILLSLVFNVYKCSYKDDNELNMINLNCIFQDFESDP